ncbi:hypothetical protein [Flavilitoribacter nigricans]|nr:hypothetical protein [Flavilitoribacter nigricans]
MAHFKTRLLPKYMLIYRNGRIVDKDAPHPGTAQLNKALQTLTR